MYVLNSDPDADGVRGNIAGFRFTRKGKMTPISNSVEPVSADDLTECVAELLLARKSVARIRRSLNFRRLYRVSSHSHLARS